MKHIRAVPPAVAIVCSQRSHEVLKHALWSLLLFRGVQQGLPAEGTSAAVPSLELRDCVICGSTISKPVAVLA